MKLRILGGSGVFRKWLSVFMIFCGLRLIDIVVYKLCVVMWYLWSRDGCDFGLVMVIRKFVVCFDSGLKCFSIMVLFGLI